MSFYKRGSSRIAQKVLAGVGFDGHIATLLIWLKQNTKLLVIKLACSTYQFVVGL